MLSIRAIRRENLGVLVRDAGSQAALAERLGKHKNQVWQWLIEDEALAASRAISDGTAREIERVVGREHGWMDHQHAVREGSAPEYDLASQPVRLDTGILRDAIRLLAMVLPITGDPPELLNDEWCIDQAYRIVARAHQARQQTDGNNLIILGADLASALRERKAKSDGTVERGTEESRPADGSNHQRRARGKN